MIQRGGIYDNKQKKLIEGKSKDYYSAVLAKIMKAKFFFKKHTNIQNIINNIIHK